MNVPVGPGGAPRRRRSDPPCPLLAGLLMLAVADAVRLGMWVGQRAWKRRAR